jgi:sulfur-oxidizing protein SoxY
MTPKRTMPLSRRDVMAGTATVAVAAGAGLSVGAPALAGPQQMADAMKQVLGGAALKSGRVKVSIPEVTENGNSMPLKMVVESPMTQADHVKALHVFSEKNPVAYIVRLGLGPRAGRAEVNTSIRVADTQRITVVAEMSDGSFWSGHADTDVVGPACVDESQIDR